MLVIQVFEIAIKPGPNEAFVQGGEAGQDASKQFLQCKGGGRVEGVERSRWRSVGCVEADADYA